MPLVKSKEKRKVTWIAIVSVGSALLSSNRGLLIEYPGMEVRFLSLAVEYECDIRLYNTISHEIL